MPHLRTAFFPLVCLAAALGAENTGLPKYSPFEARGSPGTAVATPNENIEFAGVSAIGKKTDLIIYDKTAKKNHWIGLGETKEGIEVVGYDVRREQATVKVNGVQKVLPLRKGRGPVNSPAGVAPAPTGFNVPPVLSPAIERQAPPPPPSLPTVAPAPATEGPAGDPNATQMTKPAAPVTPETQVKQETEARMLVSDLLEIGMAQRKAYEEAQRKAADNSGAQPNAAGTPQPGTPAPAPEKQN